MLLCETDVYVSSFCYWIIIGGWANTESVIRECANGIPIPGTYPIEPPACAEKRASYIVISLKFPLHSNILFVEPLRVRVP